MIDVPSGKPPSRQSHGKRQIAINTIAGGAANVVGMAIQVVMLPAMAHLVGPTEFGLYALALPTISFFSVLADGGLGASFSREAERNAVVWSTAFWILLISGISLALLVTGFGMAIGLIAHQTRLFSLMAFLSLSLMLITMSVLPTAIMTRQGNLVILICGDVASKILGALLGLSFAYWGAGVWSFAVQLMGGLLIKFVIVNTVAFYRPLWVFRPSSLGSHILTGSTIMGGRLTEFAGRMIENLIYTNIFGAPALGVYSFANQVTRYICEMVNNPVWNALYAHALHESPAEIGALHVRLCRLLGLVLMPITFLFAAVTPEIFALILGQKWITAAPIVQILIPCYAFYAISTLSGAILQANGRNSVLTMNIIGSTTGRILFVSVGIWADEIRVVLCVGLVYLLSGIAMFRCSSGITNVQARSLISELAVPTLFSAVAAVSALALLKIHLSPVWNVTLALSGGSTVYASTLIAFEYKRLLSDINALRRIASAKSD